MHDPTLCRRCGVCCMLSMRINGVAVAVPELACRHLAREGGRAACAVYARRHEVAPGCLTVPAALAEGVLERDCPYRGAADRGSGPRALGPAQALRVRPAILLAVGAAEPAWLDPAAIEAFRRR